MVRIDGNVIGREAGKVEQFDFRLLLDYWWDISHLARYLECESTDTR